MIKAELHCHLFHSSQKMKLAPIYDSVISPQQMIDECLKKDIRILAITDHNTLAGYHVVQHIITSQKLPLILIPGVEISAKEGHILAYNIHTVPKLHQPASTTIQEIHQQGGCAFLAHPFFFWGIKPNPKLPFDGIEAINGSIPDYFNRKALRYAQAHGVTTIAGSDAHQPHNIGQATTLFPDTVKNLQDVIQALKTKQHTLQQLHPFRFNPLYHLYRGLKLSSTSSPYRHLPASTSI